MFSYAELLNRFLQVIQTKQIFRNTKRGFCAARNIFVYKNNKYPFQTDKIQSIAYSYTPVISCAIWYYVFFFCLISGATFCK